MRLGPGLPVAVLAEPASVEQVDPAEVCPTWCSRLPSCGGPLEIELHEIDGLSKTLLHSCFV